jgi:hypothetical protein
MYHAQRSAITLKKSWNTRRIPSINEIFITGHAVPLSCSNIQPRSSQALCSARAEESDPASCIAAQDPRDAVAQASDPGSRPARSRPADLAARADTTAASRADASGSSRVRIRLAARALAPAPHGAHCAGRFAAAHGKVILRACPNQLKSCAL